MFEEDLSSYLQNNYCQIGIDGGHLHTFNLKTTNIFASWKLWYKHFKILLVAVNLKNVSDDRKNALLLHQMGPDCIIIFESFNINAKTVKHEELVNKFTEYFVAQDTTITESKHIDESVDVLLSKLNELKNSINCGIESQDRSKNYENLKKTVEIPKIINLSTNHTKISCVSKDVKVRDVYDNMHHTKVSIVIYFIYYYC